MPVLFLYLLQASGAMALFYLFYVACFRKETFYHYNRVLLLSIFVFSALVPLLPVPAISWSKPAAAHTAGAAQVYIPAHSPSIVFTEQEPASTPWWQPLRDHATTIITVAYFMVAFILLLVHLAQLLRIRKLLKSGNAYTKNGIRYVQVAGLHTPFSFIRTIFFDPNAHDHTELKHVLKHEEAHVHQLHSADVLLAGLYCCFCWINPAAWWCKRAMQLNLEFLADDATVKGSDAPVEYQYSILKMGIIPPKTIGLVNHFSRSFIKNRILMMNKNQSSQRRTWRYLLLAPALALSVGLLSATTPSAPANNGTKYLVTENGTTYGVVTRFTADTDFDKMKELLAKEGIALTIPTLKRNTAGEITAIKFELSYAKGKLSEGVDEEPNAKPMATFFFYRGSKEGGIGITPKKQCPQSLIEIAVNESAGTVRGITTDTAYLNRFPGGAAAFSKAMSKQLRYPRECQENNKEGLVALQYRITPDGAIKDIESLWGPDKKLFEEVKRSLGTLPAFKPDPAGKTVTVTYRVGFALQGKDDKMSDFIGMDDADLIVVGYGAK